MKKYTIIGIIIVLLIFVGANVLAARNTDQTKKVFTDKTTVKKGELKKTVSASGNIQSNTVSVLKFQTSGLMTYVGVKVGDIVKKGQLIASLDQRELQKTLKKKLEDYMTDRWTFEEDRTITYKDKALTDTIQRALDKNQFSLDKTVLDVEIADIALKFANLYSPIEGVVTAIDAPSPGVNVTAATATFTVTDYNDIVFSIDVDETDIGQVEVGQLADIKLDAYENQVFPGVISKIGFSSTTTTSGGTAFPVEVKFPDNSDLRFKVGMNGDAEIITKVINNTLYVPTDYVFDDAKGKYLNVLLSENQIVKKYVDTGIETDSDTEILSGVKEKDTVVIPSSGQ